MVRKDKVDLSKPVKGIFHIDFCSKNSFYSYLFTGLYSGLSIGLIFAASDILDLWVGSTKYDKGFALIFKWILHMTIIILITIGVILSLKYLFGWGKSVRECPPSVRSLKKKKVIK